MESSEYTSRGGLRISRTTLPLPADPRPADSAPTRGGIDASYRAAIEPVIDALDRRAGLVLSSSYEFVGRYTRWDIGFVDPPLELVARSRTFELRARNERGRVLLPALRRALVTPEIVLAETPDDRLVGEVPPGNTSFTEEERTKRPSVFTVIRRLLEALACDEDHFLGLYGAFGYDLAFQFEPIHERHARAPRDRDLVLYLPDELVIVDHQRAVARRVLYEFSVDGRSTEGMSRHTPEHPFRGGRAPMHASDHQAGEYAATVRRAIEAFRRGDLFETTPSQTFFSRCDTPPSQLFRRLRAENPSPYGAFMNLGDDEFLVSASPEMFVRVQGDHVETCPIAGTIARGRDALGDAAQIQQLLNSQKDESELTMCTDVDRNDKARICRPGTVSVLGRRQLELYSRLIHTVDHVEGRLREGYDALDAFLAHTWAVTVTGAPKTWAMQFIEDHEKSPRGWYAGAIGFVRADGSLNTGITIRTVRVRDGVAEVRAGATLLFESVPEEEERECRLKASALMSVLRGDGKRQTVAAHLPGSMGNACGVDRRILLVDHQDSFVHTLAGYLRETGASVTTLRAGFDPALLDALAPDLVVLSPGPGRPSDFALSKTLDQLLARNIGVFGVCLGLQGIVEYFGGSLDVLETPMHGKKTRINVLGGTIFEDLPRQFQAGRYHSLHARRQDFPSPLTITAESEDGVVMAIEHRHLPIAAVQFHPESILTLEGRVGHQLLAGAVRTLAGKRATTIQQTVG